LINPPSVKTNYVEIPGGDGILDLTTTLSGRPVYKNRTGSLEFIVENGFKAWSILYSEIMTYLHGQKMKAILEDDPAYYYEGRFSVNAWKSDQYNSIITIDYDVSPYKKELVSTSDDWLWDPFNFETGVIRYYKNMPINGTLTVTVIGSLISIIPTIITSATGFTVTYKGETHNLIKGPNVIPAISISNGENILNFSGTGIITIEYNGGSL
jgi:hypothetical protein